MPHEKSKLSDLVSMVTMTHFVTSLVSVSIVTNVLEIPSVFTCSVMGYTCHMIIEIIRFGFHGNGDTLSNLIILGSEEN